MAHGDSYSLLGLDPSASDADVRQAYKKAALRWHPDKNPQDRAAAESMFKKVAEAYKAISSSRASRHGHGAPRLTRPSNIQTAKERGPQRPTPPCEVEMEDAYNLFQSVFGHDPFKDFDRFFADQEQAGNPTPSFMRRVQVSTSTRKDIPAKVNFQPNVDVERVKHQRPAGTVPRWARCTSAQGVAFRRSPNFADRQVAFAGPSCGDIVRIDTVEGEWVRCAQGWLPLSIRGQQVLQLLHPWEELRARCISRQGVAFRKSANLEDRLHMFSGPVFQEIIAVEERVGEWIRCDKGWLPLSIGGQPVFELYAERTFVQINDDVQKEENEGGSVRNSWLWFAVRLWGCWSYRLANRYPTLAVCLVSISCSTLWITLYFSRMMVRGWWSSFPSFRRN
ncbi:DnaJ homolog subfamily B member 8 (mDj6) [Durusdinium trenchii]|uniref:DnaJ homolog subfamily B member 8 (MDj6) n=3 Tax=Durusdinium trenchii TaxID=1381693 RepID=A0ABP0IWA2_9DINO